MFGLENPVNRVAYLLLRFVRANFNVTVTYNTVFCLFNVEVLVFVAFYVDVFWVSGVLLILLG